MKHGRRLYARVLCKLLNLIVYCTRTSPTPLSPVGVELVNLIKFPPEILHTASFDCSPHAIINPKQKITDFVYLGNQIYTRKILTCTKQYNGTC